MQAAGASRRVDELERERGVLRNAAPARIDGMLEKSATVQHLRSELFVCDSRSAAEQERARASLAQLVVYTNSADQAAARARSACAIAPPLECAVAREFENSDRQLMCVWLIWDAKHKGSIHPPWQKLPLYSRVLCISGNRHTPTTTIVVRMPASKWTSHVLRLRRAHCTNYVWHSFLKAVSCRVQ